MRGLETWIYSTRSSTCKSIPNRRGEEGGKDVTLTKSELFTVHERILAFLSSLPLEMGIEGPSNVEVLS